MAYFHPSRPSVTLGHRGFCLKPSWNLIAQLQFVLFYTSTPPRRFTLTLAALSLTSHVDRDPLSRAPRIGFATLQHIRMEKPFFLSSFWEDIPQVLPCLRKAPPPGFGYPLGGPRSSILGGLFQPPTLMGFALQSFCLPFGGRVSVSTDPVRSCAFSHNLIDHAPALQRFPPTKRAEPLVATRRISPSRDRVLS
jgi:hypothetical protein